MIIDDQLALRAAHDLADADPVLASVIAQAGICPIRQHRNYYQELAESIIGQQLSVKAAATINRRFVELFGGTFPTPAAILEKSVEELRAAGLSNAKAAYVRDLAQHVEDGKIKLDALDKLSNDEIITELTVVKGIGEWTAHMFLMFCMARSDILATGDLGIRLGVQKLYDLDHLPAPAEITYIATKNNWAPYQSVACWYIWRSLDNQPA